MSLNLHGHDFMQPFSCLHDTFTPVHLFLMTCTHLFTTPWGPQSRCHLLSLRCYVQVSVAGHAGVHSTGLLHEPSLMVFYMASPFSVLCFTSLLGSSHRDEEASLFSQSGFCFLGSVSWTGPYLTAPSLTQFMQVIVWNLSHRVQVNSD